MGAHDSLINLCKEIADWNIKKFALVHRITAESTLIAYLVKIESVDLTVP